MYCRFRQRSSSKKIQPRYMRGVCVCVPSEQMWNFLLVFTNLQGGAEHSGDCTQRSYPLVLEAESDQLCVPAEFGLNCWTSCHVAALLSQSGNNFEIYMHQNLPQIFAETISPTVLWLFDIFSPRSCRRRNFGSFWEQSPKHYFGFSTCWSKLYGFWF